MKIVRIIARLNVGGPARHVVWLTSHLNDAEFESVLVAGSVPEGEEDMGYFAHQHGVSPVYVKAMSRELSSKDIVSLIRIYRILRRERPDIVHTHTAKAGTVGRFAAIAYRWLTPGTLIGRPRKIRIVHTFHGHVFHSYYGPLKTRFFLFIERLLARFATDRIIVISPQQFREINSTHRVGQTEKFAVVPLGIEVGMFSAMPDVRAGFRTEIGAAENEILVGFVGRLTEIKNLPMLLAAAQQIAMQPTNGLPPLKFIIAGEGYLRSDLERAAFELKLQNEVIFLGNREDIETVYNGLDVIALTSLNEGTPLSVIEAMAAGKPVIATAVGGVVDLLGEPEQELDGFALRIRGISVPSGSVEGLTKGLIYLAKNERLRKSLAEAGREFATRNHSVERLVQDIKELYRGITRR